MDWAALSGVFVLASLILIAVVIKRYLKFVAEVLKYSFPSVYRSSQQQLEESSASEPRRTDYPNRYIPKAVREAVYLRDGGRCVDCGSDTSLEYDHIIPVSKGGAATVNNVQLLCSDCNRRKSGKIGG